MTDSPSVLPFFTPESFWFIVRHFKGKNSKIFSVYTTQLLLCITFAIKPFQEKWLFYLDSHITMVG
jgi:hypothetical protein